MRTRSGTIKRLLRGMLSVGELLLWRAAARRGVGSGGTRVTVIQDCHVGDFLAALPFFQRLRDFYGCKLTLVSDRRIEPLAMASGCFGEFIGLDMRRVSSYRHPLLRGSALRRLRTLESKVLVQKYSVGGTSLEDLFAVVIPAAEKIGVESAKTDSNGGCRLYGRLLRKNFTRLYRYDEARNLLENENAFCNWICGSAYEDHVGDLACYEPLPERDAGLGRYVLFIPGADDPRRRWEPEKFAYVASEYLAADPACRVLFSGTEAEQPVIAEVLAAMPEAVRARAKVREAQKDVLSSLKRLMSDVRDAEFVLVGETGPLHIAAKFRVRCYCLSGGWHYGVWAPWPEYDRTTYFQMKCPHYGCFGLCVRPGAPFQCLKDLSPETVWETIRGQTANSRKEERP